MVSAIISAVAVMALVALAEWRHARRVRRHAHLAFGAAARGRGWTRLAPAVRALGLGLVTLGGVLLWRFDPQSAAARPSPAASKRLLICLDVSPSMLIRDAGPDFPRVARAKWAAEALRPVLDAALASDDTRITVVGFFDKAIPILIDTYDRNVVVNLFDGLRLDYAFSGPDTDLQAGVNGALELARTWARDSATLVVISDGDSRSGLTGLRPVPPGIAQTLVMGVGDVNTATEINGRRSRQDDRSLRLLATKLGGRYDDCNRVPLPASVPFNLTMRAPVALDAAAQRALGLAALGVGGVLTGTIGPVLLRWGRRSGELTRPREPAWRVGRAESTAGDMAGAARMREVTT